MNASQARILVVDDNDMNRDLLSRRLQQQNCLVTDVSNGEDALQTVREHDFDIILLDIMMPGINGFQVLEELKSSTEFRHIPVVMISALDEMDSIVKCIEMGADDYLPKPFNPVLLKARVSASLEKKRLYDQEKIYRQQLEDYNLHLEERVQEQVEQISSAQLATIFAMSKLAESKDPDTGAHLERMREYCKAIAIYLSRQPDHASQVNSTFVSGIYAASPLHDIGKVGIPDSILLKPGKLTDEEWQVMKQHPVIGANTLRAVHGQYPDNALIRIGIEIAECHHEKWDGSGYPYGLKGEAIPLSARILALADVYDALTSERCYKDAFDHKSCRETIIASKNRHFDPVVVDAFLAIEGEFRKIRDEFSDSV